MGSIQPHGTITMNCSNGPLNWEEKCNVEHDESQDAEWNKQNIDDYIKMAFPYCDYWDYDEEE